MATTVIKNPKTNKEDSISVEIGDSKQADFFPQVKLTRWDNEVNFSVRLVDSDPIIFDDKKLKAKTAKKTIKFYDLQKKKDFPDGGFEFEIDLEEKPASNIIRFSLRSKGLDFFYQPEIDDEQAQPLADKKGISLLDAKRIIRPENVLGSYAVYHKTATCYKEGWKNYGCGKAFHIYRPRIEDANGKWVWGELNIIENQEMTVTIPQDFLDNAVYPVRHAAGATFGYTSIGASVLGPSQDKMYGYRFTSPSDMGTVTGISHAICNDLSSGRDFKQVVVLQSSLNIVTNGIASAQSMPYDSDQHPDVFTSSTFSTAPTLLASTDYVLFVIHGDWDWANYSAYDTGTSGYYYFDGSNSYSSPTNPTDAVTTGDDNGGPSNAKLSIYITYTPAATTTTHFLSLMGVGT